MVLKDLENKYLDFNYFQKDTDEWVFEIENFSVTFEPNCTIEELLSDKNFIHWLDIQFKSYKEI